MIAFLFAGLALFALVGYLTYWQGRREFNRRNSVGIQVFDDYKGMVKTRAFEILVYFGGILAGIVGLICLFIYAISLTK